jgi:hypothetical protein
MSTDDQAWTSQAMIAKLMEMRNKGERLKYQAMSDESNLMDPKYKYKRDQPAELEYAEFYFKVMLAWAIQEPQDTNLMLLALQCLQWVQARMDKWGATADVLYDDSGKGNWSILGLPGEAFGSLTDIAQSMKEKKNEQSLGNSPASPPH